MDYAKLKAELTEDPAGIGYAPYIELGADGELQTLLTETRQDIVVNRLIPLSDVEEHLQSTGEFGALRRSELPLAQDAVDFIRSPRFQNLDPTNPTALALCAGLIQAGLLTEASRDAILEKGKRTGSRAEQLGLGHVSHTDIAIALRG